MLRVEPSEYFIEDYLSMCREYRDHGEADYSSIVSIEDALARLERERRYAAGIVPAGLVRNIAYWFVDEARRRLLGTGRIRPLLNERFLRVGGHIGYDVRPSERGKGIATAILAEMLGVAREFGLGEVLVTVASDNAASVRVIEKNNGVFEGFGPDEGGRSIRRYRVSVE